MQLQFSSYIQWHPSFTVLWKFVLRFLEYIRQPWFTKINNKNSNKNYNTHTLPTWERSAIWCIYMPPMTHLQSARLLSLKNNNIWLSRFLVYLCLSFIHTRFTQAKLWWGVGMGWGTHCALTSRLLFFKKQNKTARATTNLLYSQDSLQYACG